MNWARILQKAAKEIFIPDKRVAKILISIVFTRVMTTLKTVFPVTEIPKQLISHKVIRINYRREDAKRVRIPRKGTHAVILSSQSFKRK